MTLVTWFETMPPGSLKGIVLETPDIEAAYDQLSRRGVRFAGPVKKDFWGIHAEVDDPDGNGWTLMPRR